MLDSREYIVDATWETFEKHVPGVFSRDYFLQHFGNPFPEFFIQSHLTQGKVNKDQIVQTYVKCIKHGYQNKVRFFPFVEQRLQELKDYGYSLGLVTNKQKDLVYIDLNLGHLTQYFDAIVTLDDVTEGKPSPEPVLKALSALGAMPQESIMVGDTKLDVLAAQAANVRIVVLEWYGHCNWHKPVPDYCFSTLSEFSRELLGMRRLIS